MVALFKNKCNDYPSKKTCTVISTQVLSHTNQSSLLLDSPMSNAIHICFFYLFYGNLKKIALEERQIVKKNYM